MIGVVCAFFMIIGCGESVKKIEIRQRYQRGRLDNLTPEELKLEKTLKEAAQLDAAVDYAKAMFEVAYIIPVEHPDLGFTVYFDSDELMVERCLDISKEPTLVIPLSDEGIFNAKRFFEDGVVDEREEFLIVNAVFKPAWEASYRIPEIQSKWIRKFIKLDGLLHVILVNKNQYEFKGKVVKNEMSVVHVSKQWLVFQGLEGIPDQRMELTAKDAMAMYKLIMRDLKIAKSTKEKMEVMNRFKAIRDRCLVKS
jgi:hypothetical protein